MKLSQHFFFTCVYIWKIINQGIHVAQELLNCAKFVWINTTYFFALHFVMIKTYLWLLIVCGPVCVYLIAAEEQRAARSCPVGDQCESAFEDQGKSTQLKSVICGRCYLREEFEFPRVTPLVDFIHVLCYLLCLFTCNKLFNFTGLETSIWTCHFCMPLCGVTQRITTGAIPLEASVSPNWKGLTVPLTSHKSMYQLYINYVLHDLLMTIVYSSKSPHRVFMLHL